MPGIQDCCLVPVWYWHVAAIFLDEACLSPQEKGLIRSASLSAPSLWPRYKSQNQCFRHRRSILCLFLLAQDSCPSEVAGGDAGMMREAGRRGERPRRGHTQPQLTHVSNVAGLTARYTRKPVPILTWALQCQQGY